ncbi:glycosyltransferase [Desulfonatronum sp. SC1]|uniref:glycosyltransferase n=1 Tax=Desulfonatronum sp. SC1 TaxID=2109626 RepID=UPI000D2FCBD0|nr:glycosyltransferase [Desulfonatronum sp. SC1]PTN33802.1 hypothetical protein C6366_14030 [Desulfonatronum sp. SC1]
MAYPERLLAKTTHRKSKANKHAESPSMPIRPDSNKVLELLGYWSPPVPLCIPLKKTLNSSLRIACVVEDRLYHGLRFEGQVMLLTPANWKHVLKYGKPDFLLMESIWNTATGNWHMGQCPNAPSRNELLEMVSLARKLSIPTVFWITKGHEYHEHYKDFARHFNHVFCADPKETELLRAEDLKAEDLLPCVQPAIYNPFRHYEDYNVFNLDMLYDGWADLDRMADELNFLQEVKPYGLNIIESRYQIFRRRMDALPEFKDCILGCVTEQSRIQALRYAKAYITLDKTLSTRITQQWKTLEAAACRLPVVHRGSLSEDDVRKDVVIECPDQMKFLVEFVRFREDDLYRERLGHLGWRKAFQEHTFAHRIRKICKTIGIEHDWVEYPKASLITPTFRREHLPRCLQTFKQQTYPNKELVLVFNGDELPKHTDLCLDKTRDDIKISNVPGEMFAGACLNQGRALAEGEYFFRVDDDDQYGTNYILDMILQARCIDADIFGKPPAPIYFEGEDEIYMRGDTITLRVIHPELLTKKLWIGGNSFAGRRKVFSDFFFDDCSFGAADTCFLYRIREKKDYVIALMDHLNLVAERRNDQQSHTWKINPQVIKSKYFVTYHDTRDYFL